MQRKIARIGIGALVVGSLAAAHAFITPVPATAADTVYRWGISNAGDTCGSTCESGNICCKIVIVKI